MTYYESAKGVMITFERVREELREHSIEEQDIQCFFDDMGENEEYDAQDVLVWLGY